MDYTCKVCSKKFTQLRNLTRHEKTTHGEEKFVCEHCDESFKRKDAVKRHERHHQSADTHTCTNCRKSFYRRDKLVEHQILRQGNPLKRRPDENDSGEPDNHVEEDNPCSSTTAFEDFLKKIELKPRKDQKQDISHFLRGKTDSILNHLSKELVKQRGIKWFISIKVRFIKPKRDGEDVATEPHFRSHCMRTVSQHEIESQLTEAKQKTIQSLVLFQKEGSGWILDEILHLDLSIAQYSPVKGSSYIPLPSKLKTKKAIINVKNSDNKCFMWFILAALHPVKLNAERLHHY
ncbi:PR domain zinc finger protein 10-like [Dendronephthya gigantea]|uniref:PR domain zinc finger protein 10-like n=1 Tax=Dendronephthya gigantea TaxID=151771 RepID=UPI00106BF74D|nr:PR domain zinc finger protein 10-like [Dendronephthya gigantea]